MGKVIIIKDLNKTLTCKKIQTHLNFSSLYNKVYSLVLANKIDSS